ncbi:IscS subfamily cysteine desulfurase [Fictibacillus iocasae]|uniref:IscS subfamily cysteine desulfurase n=1 Tax=Fictibacillus iocasae TaxID=2715437 RepID=A0ABW2NRB1_9BACL
MNYFDYAASAPMRPEATEAYVYCAKDFYANSESLHDPGALAGDFLQHARNKLADVLSVRSDSIYFTGGGSDGNFLAITALANGNKERGRHILVSPLEHPSVMNTVHFLQSSGFEVDTLPVRADGRVHAEDLNKCVRHDTILAIIQHANSEIGTIQPMSKIGALLRERDILLHSDCCQSFGKLSMSSVIPYVSSITVSSHKIGGPKGTGAVYISPGTRAIPLMQGGVHEQGFKHGTVDVPAIASFVTAALLAHAELDDWTLHMNNMRHKLLSIIMRSENIVVERSHSPVLPHFVPIRLKGMEGQYAMLELNRQRHAVSPGSACKSGQQEPSRALLSLGRNENEARELVRITLGKETNESEIEQLGKSLLTMAANHGLTKVREHA